MFMGTAVILFGIFFLNVSMGAFGDGAFLGDVPEMLLLSGSAVFFVCAILKAEKSAKSAKLETQTK